MGIARTQETQETTFMYKKQPLKKRQNKKKFMPYFTLRTSY